MATRMSLSKEELDALTDTMILDPRPTVKQSKSVSEYSFARPNKLPKTRLRSMQTVLSALESGWSAALSSVLKVRTVMSAQSSIEASLREYSESVKSTNPVFEVTSQSTGVVIYIDMPVGLAWSIADRMVGGDGRRSEPVASLSTTQMSVLKCLMAKLVASLENAWSQLGEMQFKITGIDGLFGSSGLSADENYIVTSLNWKVGTECGTVNLAVPAKALDGIADPAEKACDAKSEDAIDTVSMKALSGLLDSVGVPVVVELGHTSISVEDVLNMEAGDIVRLETKVNDSLKVRVGEKIGFKARPGLMGRRMSAQISENQMNNSDVLGGQKDG